MSFIKNSIFGTFRDPCSSVLSATQSIEIDNSKRDSTDLPLKLQVFLTNRQQDLQMLNSTKLSFF